jgi:DNA recombination protein RmuC
MDLVYLFGASTLVLVMWGMYREVTYQSICTKVRGRESQCVTLEADLIYARQEIETLRDMNHHMHAQVKEYTTLLIDSRKEIVDHFQHVCNQSLINTQTSFLSHLEPVLSHFQQISSGHLREQSTALHTLLSPLEANLRDMRQALNTLEQSRIGAYEGLKEQVVQLSQGQKTLHTETNTLMMALRTPHVRGCWGEMQLRRVVELAGMVAYCDFEEQPVFSSQDKKGGVKPDMVIHLPGKKHIIVDAKAPLLHYLEATSAKTTQEYTQKIKEHARILAGHIKALSDKKYWTHRPNSVELTILFLPGEAFLSAALEGNPELIEIAAQRQIILATPIILIALLKTIAYGWRQDLFSKHTQQVIKLSKDLYDRLEKFHSHMHTLGKALKQGHVAYQQAMTTFQDTILPSAHYLSIFSPEGDVSDKEVA